MNFPGAFRSPKPIPSIENVLCEIDKGGPDNLFSYLKPIRRGERSRAMGLCPPALNLWMPTRTQLKNNDERFALGDGLHAGNCLRLMSRFILPKFKKIPIDIVKVKGLLNFEAPLPFFLSSWSSPWALKTSDALSRLPWRALVSCSVLKW